jgi:hypothetical protein
MVYAFDVLSPVVTPPRRQQWVSLFKQINTSVYRNLGGNWGLVAAAGEWLRYTHGWTNDTSFIIKQFGAQIPLFSPTGQYPDPNTPIPYDIFPRHYLDIMLLEGYTE